MVEQSVAELLGDPLVRGRAGDPGVQHTPGVQLDDYESEDGSKEQVVGLDEVASPGLVGVVVQEGGPVLSAATGRLDPTHMLLDSSLADPDAQLEQLASDALGAPRVVSCHLLDQLDGLRGDARLPAFRSRLVAPDYAEQIPVPGQHCLRLDHHQRVSPGRVGLGQQDHDGPVPGVEPWASDGAGQDHKLVAEQSVLCNESRLGAGQVQDRSSGGCQRCWPGDGGQPAMGSAGGVDYRLADCCQGEVQHARQDRGFLCLLKADELSSHDRSIQLNVAREDIPELL